MAQRISRAKRSIKAAGITFTMPPEASAPPGYGSSCMCST